MMWSWPGWLPAREWQPTEFLQMAAVVAIAVTCALHVYRYVRVKYKRREAAEKHRTVEEIVEEDNNIVAVQNNCVSNNCKPIGQITDKAIRDALLCWSQQVTAAYKSEGVCITDFTSSWKDGLAFLALIHHHKPSLVNWKQVKRQNCRQNLEMAFHVAEKSLGVVRQLSSEDLNDEHRLITYVSALYDVFPETSIIHFPSVSNGIPVNGHERALYWKNYHVASTKLLDNLRQGNARLNMRDFPNSLTEMRALFVEYQQRKCDELLTLAQMQQHCVSLWNQLTSAYESESETDESTQDMEVRPEDLQKLQEKYALSLQEMELTMQSELKRLERLHRAAEMLYVAIKECAGRLDAAETLLRDFETKRCDAVSASRSLSWTLTEEESVISRLFSQIQNLHKSRYNHAEPFDRRVSRLQRRWQELKRRAKEKKLFHEANATSSASANLLRSSALALKEWNGVDQEKPIFQAFLTYLNWLQVQPHEINAVPLECVTSQYSLPIPQRRLEDLCAVQNAQKRLHAFQTLLSQAEARLEELISSQHELLVHENAVFNALVDLAHVELDRLSEAIQQRLQAADALAQFIEEADQELCWLKSQEEVELSRDWNVNVSEQQLDEIYAHGQNLMNQMEYREAKFSGLVSQGTSLFMASHPSSKTIQLYVMMLENQWFWLLQLSHCFELHLDTMSRRCSFLKQVAETNSWIRMQTERLSGHFLRSEGVTVHEGEALIRELRKLHDQLQDYQNRAAQLYDMAQKVEPLALRTRRHDSPICGALTICTIPLNENFGHGSGGDSFVLEKNQKVRIMDNSGQQWRVRTESEMECVIPAVCIYLPPPCVEAVEAAREVRVKLQHLAELWVKRELHLRQELICATMRVVRAWLPEEFCLLEPAHRRGVVEALNHDAERLIQDMQVSKLDVAQIERFHRELLNCNVFFGQMNSRTASDVDSMSVYLIMNQINMLRCIFNSMLATLNQKLANPVASNLDQLEMLVLQHRDFESNLQSYESQLHHVLSTGRNADQVDAVEKLWTTLWQQAQAYVARLKSSEAYLSNLDQLNCTIDSVEMGLIENKKGEFNGAESFQLHIEAIKKLNSQLLDCEERATAMSNHLDALCRGLSNTPAGSNLLVVESARLSNDVRFVQHRWQDVHNQLEVGLSQLENCMHLFNIYRSKSKMQNDWLFQLQASVLQITSVELPSIVEQQIERLEKCTQLIEEMELHRATIEEVFDDGANFIKTFELYTKGPATPIHGVTSDVITEVRRIINDYNEKLCALHNLQDAMHGAIRKLDKDVALASHNYKQLQTNDSHFKTEEPSIGIEEVEDKVLDSNERSEDRRVLNFNSDASAIIDWCNRSLRLLDLEAVAGLGQVLSERDQNLDIMLSLDNFVKEMRDSNKSIDTLQVENKWLELQNVWAVLETNLESLKNKQVENFKSLCEGVQSWLDTQEALLNQLLPLAITLKQIHHQNTELKNLIHSHQNYKEHIEEINQLVSTQRALFHSNEKSISGEMQELQDINFRFSLLGDRLAVRYVEMSKSLQSAAIESDELTIQATPVTPCFPHLGLHFFSNHKHALQNQFLESLDNLCVWLDSEEERACNANTTRLILSYDAAENAYHEAMFELNVIQNMSQKLLEIERLAAAECSAVELDLLERYAINDALQKVAQRYGLLFEGARTRLTSMEHIVDLLRKYALVKEDIISSLELCEENWKRLSNQGEDRSDMIIECGNDLAKEVEDLKASFIQLHVLNEAVVFELSSRAETTVFFEFNSRPEDVSDLQVRHTHLFKSLHQFLNDLEDTADVLKRFESRAQRLARQIDDLYSNLDLLQPLNLDRASLNDQIASLQMICTEAEEYTTDTNLLLSEASGSDVSSVLGAQIRDMLKKCQLLHTQAHDSIKLYKCKLKQLCAFEPCIELLRNNLVSTLSATLSIISSTTNAGSDTEEMLEQLQEKSVAPLQQRVDEVMRKGESLLMDAPEDLASTKMEQDFDWLSVQLDQIQQLLNEVEQNVEKSLIFAAYFQESYGTMLNWIENIKIKLTCQKELSAEYHVVMNQLYEQRSVCKMIQDRQSSVELLIKAGELAYTTNEENIQDQVKKQLSDIRLQYSELQSSASYRLDKLEQVSRLSKQLHEKYQPILAWLDSVEYQVEQLKNSIMDANLTQGQIELCKNTIQDLLDQRDHLHELHEIVLELIDRLSASNGDAFKKKIEQIAERYDRLHEFLENKMSKLLTVDQQLRHFRDRSTRLSEWLCVVERALNTYEINLDDFESNKASIAELKNLLVEFQQHEFEVEELKCIVDDLTANPKSMDTALLHNKLESVTQYFDDTHLKLTSLLDTMTEVLPLLQRFTLSCQSLDKSLREIETALRSLRVITEQLELTRPLENCLEHLQPITKALDEDGQQLMKLLAVDHSERIGELLDSYLSRYQQLSEEVRRYSCKFGDERKLVDKAHHNLDNLCASLRALQTSLSSAPAPSQDPVIMVDQIKVHDTLMLQFKERRSELQQVLREGRAVVCKVPQRELISLRELLENAADLQQQVERAILQRHQMLNEAMPLAKEFDKATTMLDEWMKELECMEILSNDLLLNELGKAELLQIEDKIKCLAQTAMDRKQLLEILNKTGPALSTLVSERDGIILGDTIQVINEHFKEAEQLIKNRLSDVENLLSSTNQFEERLNTAEGHITAIRQTILSLELTSPFPDKLREQIEETNMIRNELQQRRDILEQVQNGARDLFSNLVDENVDELRLIDKRLDDLKRMCQDLLQLCCDRVQELELTLQIASKFWSQLHETGLAIDELQNELTKEQPAHVEPEQIDLQRDLLKKLSECLTAGLQALAILHEESNRLIAKVGLDDKLEVEQQVSKVEFVAFELEKNMTFRRTTLDSQHIAASHFQMELIQVIDWIDMTEKSVLDFEEIGVNSDTVRNQLNAMRLLKKELESRNENIEGLNQRGFVLTKDSSPEARRMIEEKLTRINQRWLTLIDVANERQHQLQNTLLSLGELVQTLDELIQWIQQMDRTLDIMQVIHGDPEAIEMLMAKLKMLNNDLTGHRNNVTRVHEMAKKLVLSKRSTGTSQHHEQLNKLSESWKALLDKAQAKQLSLEEALHDSVTFQCETDDILRQLSELESQLNTMDMLGALPDTIRHQQRRFEEIVENFAGIEKDITKLMQRGRSLQALARDSVSRRLAEQMDGLQSRCSQLHQDVAKRRVQLNGTLKEAEQFYAFLNQLINWLTLTESSLSQLKPASRLLDSLSQQIEDHERLKANIDEHTTDLETLDQMSLFLNHCKVKHDIILTRNLTASVHLRWEKVVSRSRERTRLLQQAQKEATQFHSVVNELILWLHKQLAHLNSESLVHNDAENLRNQIEAHRVFQHELAIKHPSYDAALRIGKQIKERAPDADQVALSDSVSQLKQLWAQLCSSSVDRQRKLEESMLYYGQVKEVLTELLDWLKNSESQLLKSEALRGDLDTVRRLLEAQCNFSKELENRQRALTTMRCCAAEQGKASDSSLNEKLENVDLLLQRVTNLNSVRRTRLTEAHIMAEQFAYQSGQMLDYYRAFETNLRKLKAQSDGTGSAQEEDDVNVNQWILQHNQLHEDFVSRRLKLDECLNLGRDILKNAHFDAIDPLNKWLKILVNRWDELAQKSAQSGEALRTIFELRNKRNQAIEDLLRWLNTSIASIKDLSSKDMPRSIAELRELLQKHTSAEEDTIHQKVEYDTILQHAKSQSTVFTSGSGAKKCNHSSSKTKTGTADDVQFKNAKVNQIKKKWDQLEALNVERRRHLQEALDYALEFERLKNFDFNVWRQQYNSWMNENKIRVMDFFRQRDTDHDGRVTREEFVNGILESRFPTSRLEMEAVADIFDRDQDGFIDYKEFIAALRPGSEVAKKLLNDDERIHEEMKRQVKKCTCKHPFFLKKVGEAKYQCGESKKLCLVRILRSTVMVRVGGGWQVLEEFLLKNDPCRAKGRTNVELHGTPNSVKLVAQGLTKMNTRSIGSTDDVRPSVKERASSSSSSSTRTASFEQNIANPSPSSKKRT